MIYEITAYHTSGDVAYTVVVEAESQMIQELKDAINDGFAVLVCKKQKD